MKIAIFSEEFLPQMTGVSVNLMKKLTLFSQQGHVVRVYSPDYSLLSENYPDWEDYVGEILPGITVVPFPSQVASMGELGKATMVDPKPFSLTKMDQNLLDFEPDIIHVDSPERLFFGFLSIPGKSIAKKLDIPLVCFYRTHFAQVVPTLGDYIWWTKLPGVQTALEWITRWAYNRYPLVLTASSDTEKQLNDWGIRHTLKENLLGVDLHKFTPKTKVTGSKFHIINVSRYDPDKNVSLLLETCEAISKLGIPCKFTFVGHGVQSPEVEAWVASQPDADFVGMVTNEETAAYYQQADLFITAATAETFGTTLIEAASCGLPLMGYAKGAVRDRIGHNRNGFLIKEGNTTEFAEQVRTLMLDEKKQFQFSEHSRQIAKQYSNEMTTQNLLNIWESLIADHATSKASLLN